jgi:hypothetical protein
MTQELTNAFGRHPLFRQPASVSVPQLVTAQTDTCLLAVSLQAILDARNGQWAAVLV